MEFVFALQKQHKAKTELSPPFGREQGSVFVSPNLVLPSLWEGDSLPFGLFLQSKKKGEREQKQGSIFVSTLVWSLFLQCKNKTKQTTGFVFAKQKQGDKNQPGKGKRSFNNKKLIQFEVGQVQLPLPPPPFDSSIIALFSAKTSPFLLSS